MSEHNSGEKKTPINEIQNTTEVKSVVDSEVAKVEVEKWTSYKRFKASKLDALKENIDALENAVSDGTVTIDSEMNIIHTLAFPIKNSSGEVTVKQFKYKARLNDKMIKAAMKGAKPTDADERVTRIISALTGEVPAVVDNLDSVDSSISKNICMFFL